MGKMKMHSPDLVAENIDRIAELFPQCLVECRDESGKLTRKIDFEALQQELSGSVIDGSQERYMLNWPGKREAILLANSPVAKTLRPCREESVDFDNTKNLYIEGDNLEVLKLLRDTYLGKVKMIYIDPPYNTGNDFIYEDDFAEDAESYLLKSNQIDEQGARLAANPETKGRYHSDWLTMIYPRLRLAHQLLRDDGVIFISIDDNEVHNLRKICDEIFNSSNFISEIIWQNKKGGGNDSTYIAIEHEYIVIYAKNKNHLIEFYQSYSEEYLKRYKEEDKIGKFYWDTFKRKSGKQYYPIECPDGTILEFDDDGNRISWLRSPKRFKADKLNGEIRFIKNNTSWSVQFKQRMPLGKKPRSIFEFNEILKDKGTTSSGSDDVYQYFKKDIFSNPKPVELIKFLLSFGMQSDNIVLDFFSGSGTIAESLMEINGVDNRKCKYIAVQIQEDLNKMLKETPLSKRLIIENAISLLIELEKPLFITELAKERIRRAGMKIKAEWEEKQKKNKDDLFTGNEEVPALDIGFRVLKLDSSNMEEVYYTPDATEQENLAGIIDNIKVDRTAEDLLFQVMLDWGVELSLPITMEKLKGKTVYFVDDDAIAACFDNNITDELIQAIAERKVLRAVFRDNGFGDSSKINVVEIFKQLSPSTDIKVI